MARKVLLADDEEGMLALVSATLGGNEQYELLVARDGEEALRIAQAELPDLALLDISMPKRDGVEVCRHLKEDPATNRIKIVMLTALTQEADLRRAREAGADDYFTKPFSPTALLEKVDELLARG